MIFCILVTLLLSVSYTSASGFHYPDLGKNEAFPKWEGLCDKGKAQSPINLLRNFSRALYKPLTIKNYNAPQSPVYAINNGHTVQLYNFDQPMDLSGGPLNDTYQVQQIHFHWGSEHTIDSVRYPFEVHIVHKNKKYFSLKEAAAIPDGIAVVGILFHLNNYMKNQAVQTVLDVLDEISEPDKVGEPAKLKSPFQTQALLADFHDYFTYHGSLTTPGCDESVVWIVSKKTFPISPKQVEAFKNVSDKGGHHLENNYRFVQNLNGRKVEIVRSGINIVYGNPFSGGAAVTFHLPVTVLFLISIMTMFLQ